MFIFDIWFVRPLGRNGFIFYRWYFFFCRQLRLEVTERNSIKIVGQWARFCNIVSLGTFP